MAIFNQAVGLTTIQACVKRGFDFCLAFFGLLATWWLILFAWLAATIDTGQNGFFTQKRVGRFGKTFKVIKIRTMKPVPGVDTTVTTCEDPRITKLGHFLRKTKADELPQLLNVLVGQMSFVGPRPDVPGFADKLKGEDMLILTLRPGITGPATLKYRDEEKILCEQADPEKYNHDVIFPEKVRINMDYIKNYTLLSDLKYIFQTLVGK